MAEKAKSVLPMILSAYGGCADDLYRGLQREFARQHYSVDVPFTCFDIAAGEQVFVVRKNAKGGASPFLRGTYTGTQVLLTLLRREVMSEKNLITVIKTACEAVDLEIGEPVNSTHGKTYVVKKKEPKPAEGDQASKHGYNGAFDPDLTSRDIERLIDPDCDDAGRPFG